MSTTQQMVDAPTHALFIWCDDGLRYPMRLAHFLRRDDLQIFPRSALSSRQLYEQEFTALVLDHSITDLTGSERETIQHIEERMIR